MTKEKEQRDLRICELEQTKTRLEAEQKETEGKATAIAEERRALESIEEASVELASVIVGNGNEVNRRTICTLGMSQQSAGDDGAISRDDSGSSGNELSRKHRLSNSWRTYEERFSPNRRSCCRESSLRLFSAPKSSEWRRSRTP